MLVALETEKVTVVIPKRLGTEDTQQVTWPLRGTVWACADQQQRNKAFGRADIEVIKAHSMQVRLCLMCGQNYCALTMHLFFFSGMFIVKQSFCGVRALTFFINRCH